MEKKQVKIRIEKLKKEIDHHRYLYHVLDRIEISDGALDSLKNELEKLEREYPEFLTADSPTQRVGGEVVDGFKKHKHSRPMLSMFDAFSDEDMRDWEGRLQKILIQKNISSKIEYYCELKMDGLASAIGYEKAVFKTGATRGDGTVGEDVSPNLKTIEAIPLNLRIPKKDDLEKIGVKKENISSILDLVKTGYVEARGEAIMTKKVFDNLNKRYKKEGKNTFANPRNAAAGTIRQLDSKVVAERKLDFYVYSLLLGDGQLLETREQEHNLARLLGFKVLSENKTANSIEDVCQIHQYWDKKRDKLPFECDGLVVKVNDLSLWPVLGVVGKGPRYYMAYKFAAEQVTTKVLEVKWQIGRTGTLTPIAVLNPVRVGGVTVSHSTLHNVDEIKRLSLRVGDTVIIERAGDVIPKIIKSLTNLRTGNEVEIEIPSHCPICSSPVEKTKGEVAYRCSNKNCFAVNLRNLTHWASKSALDIDGLGEKVVEQLVNEKLVSDISDFYALSEGDLSSLERFAEKSAQNLIQAINDKKLIEYSRFLIGLGIRHVGEETAIVLSKKFPLQKGDLLELIEVFSNIPEEKLESIQDIGPKVATSIFDWFKETDNINLLRRMSELGVRIKKEEKSNNNDLLLGKIFVLTGTLNGLTRDEAKAKIREYGASISSSISTKTDYLLAGEKAGSKLEKAKKLGVKILNEEEFLKMIK